MLHVDCEQQRWWHEMIDKMVDWMKNCLYIEKARLRKTQEQQQNINKYFFVILIYINVIWVVYSCGCNQFRHMCTYVDVLAYPLTHCAHLRANVHFLHLRSTHWLPHFAIISSYEEENAARTCTAVKVLRYMLHVRRMVYSLCCYAMLVPLLRMLSVRMCELLVAWAAVSITHADLWVRMTCHIPTWIYVCDLKAYKFINLCTYICMYVFKNWKKFLINKYIFIQYIASLSHFCHSVGRCCTL